MKFYRLLICCLTLSSWCAAVQPYEPTVADPILEPWRWKHEQALEDLNVLCVDEADDGSLWFGNVGSLAHYDGVTVTRIPFDNELSLKITHQEAVPWAKAICVMENGDPLVLVGQSLVLRAEDRWNVVVKDVGQSVFTARMEQADDGSIWLLVPGALWWVSGDLSKSSVVMSSREKKALKSFCLDSKGDVWVVEQSGAEQSELVNIPVRKGRAADRADWKRFLIPFKDPVSDESKIEADDNGMIRYVNRDSNTGFEGFDIRHSKWIQTDAVRKTWGGYSLFKGLDGSVWAGLEGQIACLLPDGKEVLYSNDQLQLPQVPFSLYETRNHRMWVIGRIGHVYSVDIGTDEWMTYEGLNFQCESEDGTQWFLSKTREHVISHYPLFDLWRRYSQDDGIIDKTSSIICSSQGLIWVAGSHKDRAAFCVFDGSRWTRFRHPEFAEWIEPKAVFEASDGTVWFGAGGGVLSGVPKAGGALQYEVRPDRSVHLLKHHSPPVFPYYVNVFAQTPDQTLWVGSTKVHKYDGVSLTTDRLLSLSLDNTVDLLLDRNQMLWVAKEQFGIYRQQGTSWRVFTSDDGLASLILSDLLELRDGTVLASSNKGISRFDGKNWMPYAYPEWFAMSRRWSSMRQSKDGSIWLNYVAAEARTPRMIVNRIERFSAIRHRPETEPPDTHIVRYLKEVAQPGNSHIEWTAHDPWSNTPRKDLQYSWRLDEGEWSSFSDETSRTFLDLDSGQHVLEVRARDRAFNVDPTPDRVEFVVVAPVWRQPWMIGMVSGFSLLLMISISISVGIRRKQRLERERHLMEVDQLKTSFFTNISHELNTPLMLIMGPLERLLKSETNDVKKKMLSMALRNVSRVENLASQLLDFRKLEQGKLQIDIQEGDIEPVVRETVELLQPLANMHSISCSMESGGVCHGWFDAEKLKKITTNLVGNAIKYTPAGGEVRVLLDTVSDKNGHAVLSLMVEDTGSGIEPEHLKRIFDRFYRIPEKSIVDGSGIGLNLTKQLVDLWQGEIRAESPIYEDKDRPGTRFVVYLPIDKNTVPRNDRA